MQHLADEYSHLSYRSGSANLEKAIQNVDNHIDHFSSSAIHAPERLEALGTLRALKMQLEHKLIKSEKLEKGKRHLANFQMSRNMKRTPSPSAGHDDVGVVEIDKNNLQTTTKQFVEKNIPVHIESHQHTPPTIITDSPSLSSSSQLTTTSDTTVSTDSPSLCFSSQLTKTTSDTTFHEYCEKLINLIRPNPKQILDKLELQFPSVIPTLNEMYSKHKFDIHHVEEFFTLPNGKKDIFILQELISKVTTLAEDQNQEKKIVIQKAEDQKHDVESRGSFQENKIVIQKAEDQNQEKKIVIQKAEDQKQEKKMDNTLPFRQILEKTRIVIQKAEDISNVQKNDPTKTNFYKQRLIEKEKEVLKLQQSLEDFKILKKGFEQKSKQEENTWNQKENGYRTKITELNGEIQAKQGLLEETFEIIKGKQLDIETLKKQNDMVDGQLTGTSMRLTQETDELRIENDRIKGQVNKVNYEKTEMHKELCDARLEIARLDEELKTQLAKQLAGETKKPRESPQNDRILGQVKELTNNLHNLVNQLCVYSNKSAVEGEVPTENLRGRQETELNLKKKVDEILYILNPVNQLISPVVQQQPRGGSLANNEKIKQMLNQRKALINKNDELREIIKTLLNEKKSVSIQYQQVTEEKSMMLTKLKDSLSLILQEKELVSQQRTDIEERCLEYQEALEILRDRCRAQEIELRKYKANIDNINRSTEQSQVMAEASSIQSFAYKKENDKLRRDVEEYKDRIQAMLTNKEGLARTIRDQSRLIEELTLERTQLLMKLKIFEQVEGDVQTPNGTVSESIVLEIQASNDTLREQSEELRKEKYSLQKQVDEVDDKLNSLHMIICDLENEKQVISTELELLRKTSSKGLTLPMIDPTDPRIRKRLDQFGLLPPPKGTGVMEGIFEFLFPFLFEEEDDDRF